MYYNLQDPDQEAQLNTLIAKWITEAESEHAKMFSEWDEADDYYENDQTPPGFNDDVSAQTSAVNSPDVQQDASTARQYIVVNKVRETHDSILADFIGAKKTISARGRTPKDRKLASVISRSLEHIQDSATFWEEIATPTIDCAIRRGLHWIKPKYNSRVNLPLGKIDFEEISTRDVLVDPNSRKPFYQDASYKIHRVRKAVDDANREFRHLIGDQKFSPDTLFDQSHANRDTTETTTDFCTIYEIQYTEIEERYFFSNPKTQQVAEIGQAQYESLSSNPKTSTLVFLQEEETHYVALYNHSMDTFYNAENEYGICTLIPCVNIPSEGRLYPLGDVSFYKNLQDLFNVLVSLLLDNVKKGNSGIYYAKDPQSYEQYAAEYNAAVRSRGKRVAPGEMGVLYPRELANGVMQLLQQTEKFIYDVQSKHEASRGELPHSQIAQRTVSMLIAQDRKSHGRKDINIKWSLTQVGRVLVKIMGKKFTEPHWVVLTDEAKGDQYIPINFTVTEVEYKGLLMEIMGIDERQAADPNAALEIEQAIAGFRRQFEKENEVKFEPTNIYQVGDKELSEQDLQEFLLETKMGVTQFMAKYRPVVRQATLVIINRIEEDPDIDLIYDIDFNFEADRQYRREEAFNLFKAGAYTVRRLLKALDHPEAEEAAREVEEQNQMLQIGKRIVSAGPQALETVMAFLEQLKSGNNQPPAAA